MLKNRAYPDCHGVTPIVYFSHSSSSSKAFYFLFPCCLLSFTFPLMFSKHKNCILLRTVQRLIHSYFGETKFLCNLARYGQLHFWEVRLPVFMNDDVIKIFLKLQRKAHTQSSDTGFFTVLVVSNSNRFLALTMRVHILST